MKILLSELDERVDIKVDRSIRADGVSGAMKFGDKNDYPQRIERLLLGSVTGKSASNAYAKFLTGSGFESEINNIVVGYDYRHKQVTIRDLLSKVCFSMAFYNGAYLHLNLTLNRKVKDVQHILFKNCRFSELDDTGYTSKIGYYENWEKRKGVKYDKNKIRWYNIFNLNEKVFDTQVKNAGGVEKYKGQVYFQFLDNNYIYPLSPFDPSYIDLDTEAQLGYHKNNEVSNGFSSKTVIQLNQALNDTAKEEMSDGIKSWIGSRGSKVLVIEAESDENGQIIENKAIKIDKIDSNVDSKLYENWEKGLANNIRKPITIPAILIDYEENKLGSTSGEAIIQATNFFNQVTKDDRASVSRMFKEIFSNSDNKDLANNTNWNIKPLSLYEPTNTGTTTEH